MTFESETFWVQLYDLPIYYMNRRHKTQIGSAIGKVVDMDVDVDVNDDDTCWGNHLRVRIEISLKKP